jgi:hypothetical protein
MYLSIFLVYLKVFECIHSIFECIYSIFMVYFNAFIVCFNVFHCISMCLNVDIVIGILPSHFHCTFLPCTFTFTFFFHSTQ